MKRLIYFFLLLGMVSCESLRNYYISPAGDIRPKKPKFELKGKFDPSSCSIEVPFVYHKHVSSVENSNVLASDLYYIGLPDGRFYVGPASPEVFSDSLSWSQFIDKEGIQYFVCDEESGNLLVEWFQMGSSMNGYYEVETYSIVEHLLITPYNARAYYQSEYSKILGENWEKWKMGD